MRLTLPLGLMLLAGGGAGPQRGGKGTTLLLAAAAAPAPHAFPWLWSGIPGLSPACDLALAGIEARLAAGDIEATMLTMKAKVASGHVMEPLIAVGQGTRMAEAHPLTPAQVGHYAYGYSWSSPGNPDGCRVITAGDDAAAAQNPAFHACLVDASGPFMRFGLCAPRACTSQDVVLGFGETLRRIMPPLPPNDPVMQLLQAKTDCGDDQGFPWTAGTWAVLSVCGALAALVAVASAVDLLEGWRHWQQAAGGEKGAFVVVATETEAEEEMGKGRGWRRGLKDALLCFSLPRNWKALMAPGRAAAASAAVKTSAESSQQHHNQGEAATNTAALDGVRALSMLWIVFGHVFVFGMTVLGYANMTPSVAGTLVPLTPDGTQAIPGARPTAPGFMGTWGGQAAISTYLAVDTFLFLSGFLAVRGLLLRHRRRPTATAATALLREAPKMYLLRYLRLTPAYALVLFAYWQLLGAVGGKGPTWRAAFRSEYEICERIWWANFLYANNFITATNGDTGLRGYSCMPASWYLAVDFQLFLLAPPVAALAAARPRLALLLLGLGAAASVAYTVGAGTVGGWSFQMIGGGEGFIRYFTRFYTKPWARAIPSLIGMGLAVLLFAICSSRPHQDHKPERPPPTATTAPFPSPHAALLSRIHARSLLAWTVALALIALAAEGSRGAFTTVPSLWTSLQYCLYLALSRLAWGLGLALLAHRLFLGEGGPIRRLLESRALAVLSRTAYCMYLVHPAVIYWVFAQQHSPVHFSGLWLCVTYLGILALTILLAALIYLGVEQPAANLQRLFLHRRRSITTKPTTTAAAACPPPAEFPSHGGSATTATEGEGEEDGAGLVEIELEGIQEEAKFEHGV